MDYSSQVLEKINRRAALSQEIQSWLAEQPGRCVVENAFAARVGNPSDTASLLNYKGTPFRLFWRDNRRWVELVENGQNSADQNGRNPISRAARKAQRLAARQEQEAAYQQRCSAYQAWLTEQPDHRVPREQFALQVGGGKVINELLHHKNTPFVRLRIERQEWIGLIEEQNLRFPHEETHAEKTTRIAQEKAQRELAQQQRKADIQRLRGDMLDWLAEREHSMAPKNEFMALFSGQPYFNELSRDQSLLIYFEYEGQHWVQPADYYRQTFHVQVEAYQKALVNNAWQVLAERCGSVVRPNSSKAKSGRLFIIARTYTPEMASRVLLSPPRCIRLAAEHGAIPSFLDPVGTLRIPAEFVQRAAGDTAIAEQIAGYNIVKVRQISLVAGFSYSTARARLLKANLSTITPLWFQVRGQWGLPDTWAEFKKILDERYPVWLALTLGTRYAGTEQARQAILERDTKQRQERDALRQRLISVFPTWDHDRSQQRFILHTGPTNSGKTHAGLCHLIKAGSGWYLSPLRLLAHEVYDTLNNRGVPCNLLTGEETRWVPGAQITSATVEMFNPQRSGQCILIDETHMLADSQRGWAWTRALMETTAREVHLAGSHIGEYLAGRLLEELGVPCEIQRYERLTPLQVAERRWTLATLPARTILVAFSRRAVLALKTDLEQRFQRTVSVVYGNLPPEVRMRQAERFAAGTAEICVATDAIGMGLNLPADNVCFYEIEKFDGVRVRRLDGNEIRQIAGRAGRFGLSTQGMVGALSKGDLAAVASALEKLPPEPTCAYVAPTVDALRLINGSLEKKLRIWQELAGIPERWRSLIRPVNLEEQIRLATMLNRQQVKKLGLEGALQLINAPCDQNSEYYWRMCAEAIIGQYSMPLPVDDIPDRIHSADALALYEARVRQADLYLWLANRPSFASCGPDVDDVREYRDKLSEAIDAALLSRIDTSRHCRDCGRTLPPSHPYGICERCYSDRQFSNGRYQEELDEY